MRWIEKEITNLDNEKKRIEKETHLRDYIGLVNKEIGEKAKEKLKIVLDLED